jgi:hypothetical protein
MQIQKRNTEPLFRIEKYAETRMNIDLFRMFRMKEEIGDGRTKRDTAARLGSTPGGLRSSTSRAEQEPGQYRDARRCAGSLRLPIRSGRVAAAIHLVAGFDLQMHPRSFGGVPTLHRSFCDWEIARDEVPCDRPTFELMLSELGFLTGEIAGTLLVSGLILKEDATACN